MKLILPEDTLVQIAELYDDMEKAYDRVASAIGLSCTGCPDNCCDSYFLHHTYTEWAYLILGFSRLPEETQRAIHDRSLSYITQCHKELGEGRRPKVMCPLNESGRCILYKHRLMVCRTHGVPAVMTRPDGRRLNFPGCFRCQGIVEQQYQGKDEIPEMERTPLLSRLVSLEQDLLKGKRHMAPKVKKTIAEMIIEGLPEAPGCMFR